MTRADVERNKGHAVGQDMLQQFYRSKEDISRVVPRDTMSWFYSLFAPALSGRRGVCYIAALPCAMLSREMWR